jgi:hypothetical protein
MNVQIRQKDMGIERRAIMQVWVCSSCEYDSVGGERVKVFSNKEGAYKLACEGVVEFMKDAFEADHPDFVFVSDCFGKREYYDGFKYWENEIYSPSEKDEHPIIDVYPVHLQ